MKRRHLATAHMGGLDKQQVSLTIQQWGIQRERRLLNTGILSYSLHLNPGLLTKHLEPSSPSGLFMFTSLFSFEDVFLISELFWKIWPGLWPLNILENWFSVSLKWLILSSPKVQMHNGSTEFLILHSKILSGQLCTIPCPSFLLHI